MPEPGDFLTVKQLCASLDIDQSTLYRWRKAGNGPQAIKVRNSVRFRQSDVDAWLATHRVQETTS